MTKDDHIPSVWERESVITFEMENQDSRKSRITNIKDLIDLDLTQIFRFLHPMQCPNVGSSNSISIILIDR